MSPGQWIGRAVVVGVVGWFVVSEGLSPVVVPMVIVVLAAQRTVLDRSRTATPVEAAAGVACVLAALVTVDADAVGAATRNPVWLALLALVSASVIGLGVVLHDRHGPGGSRFAVAAGGLVLSVVILAGARQSGAPMTLWPLWIVPAALLVQLRQQSAGAAGGHRSKHRRGRWAAAAVLATLVVLLMAPLGELIELVPRFERDERADGDGDGDPSGVDATPYWGFDDRLDTSIRGDLSDREVLRVTSELPAFWRATTYDDWDGRVWTRSASIADEFEVPVVDGEFRILDQEVELLEPVGDVIVGAPTIVTVDGLAARPGPAGTWVPDEPVGAGSTYDVSSYLSLSDSESLRMLDPSTVALPDDIARHAEPLPTTDRVRALAAELAATATTDFDRVQAMIDWIGDHTEYDRDSPVPEAGADAVDAFLFEDRVGFCEQIASALVVMAREAGMPARLAVGFVPGEQTGRQTWTSTGADAHAWVEIWFPRSGWVGFDPTADVPLAGEYDDGPDLAAILVRVLIGLGIVAGAIGIAWLLGRRRPARVAGDDLQVLVERFSAIGTRRPDETIREYGDRMAATVGDDRPARIAGILDRASYDVPPATIDRDAVVAEIDRLEQVMSLLTSSD